MIIDVVQAVGEQALWKQERIILYVQARGQVKFYTDLEGSAASPIATYEVVSRDEIYIDITDYVRAYDNVEHLYIVDVDASVTYDVEVDVKGLINPEGVLIPDHALRYDAVIIPPSLMICALDHENLEQAEFYATGGSWSVVGTASLSADKRSVGQINGAFKLTDGTHSKNYTPKTFRCDVQYALVRWVSFTGETRAHWFEVTKQKSDTAGAYNLLPIDNEYVEIKGRVDGFTLRLDGLNRYDLWYYADVLNSSKVEVSFNGSTWARVQITTKSITLPDGESGKNGKLEIQVNWKRYDAVAM